MKWFAHENMLYTVFWSASLGICGTLDNYQFLDYYSEPESQNLWAGRCAKGIYVNPAGEKGDQAVQLDAACVETGNCATCLKRGLASLVRRDCAVGAKDAVKKVLQDNVGAIGSTISQAIVAELDSESLQEVAGQAMADACQTCLDAIVYGLMEVSPSACIGGESCSGVDYMAGLAMQYMGISGKCSAASSSLGGSSGGGGGGASGDGGGGGGGSMTVKSTATIIVTNCGVAVNMLGSSEVKTSFASALRKTMLNVEVKTVNLRAPGCLASGGRRLQSAELWAEFTMGVPTTFVLTTSSMPSPAAFKSALEVELEQTLFQNDIVFIASFSNPLKTEGTTASQRESTSASQKKSSGLVVKIIFALVLSSSNMIVQ